jgi:hypothetical protein
MLAPPANPQKLPKKYFESRDDPGFIHLEALASLTQGKALPCPGLLAQGLISSPPTGHRADPGATARRSERTQHKAGHVITA